MDRVLVEDVEFKFHAAYGEMGFIIKPDGWKNWESGPGTRGERIDIPHGDGQFDLPVFRSSRSPQVSGHAFAEDDGELLDMGDQFTGLLAEGPGVVVVEMAHSTRWARVRLGDEPLFVPHGGSSYATFTLQMWAPDPRKFGEFPRYFLGGEVARHYGNVTAAPVHTVSGSMPNGYTLNGPAGKQFIVTAPLVPGVPHRIDMETAELFVGGVLTYRKVLRPETWGIPKGVGVVHTVTGAGSADLVTEVYDTYM